MGENKFPWVVATPNSLAAKSQQQRMRIASAAAAQSTSLLTHKFNVCVYSTPFPFALSLTHTHTRADMTNQNKLSTLLSLYSEFHMNFAKIQFE